MALNIINLSKDQVPVSSRIFAIGDVHGCLSELETLVSYIVEEENLLESEYVVFLGDYIDRGEESKEVIQFLIDFGKSHPNSLFLKGNHEDMLLDVLGFGGQWGEFYLVNGGTNTAISYGIDEYIKFRGLSSECSIVDITEEELHNKFPEGHLDFLLSLTSMVIHSDYVFVHAGIYPRTELSDQTSRDLYWIRDNFIKNLHKISVPQTIVHGHTPVDKVMFKGAPGKGSRIAVDTGCCYSGGKLSAIELSTLKVISVEGRHRPIVSFLPRREE